MGVQIPISKAEIKKIYKELPAGYGPALKKRTGFKLSYIYRFFGGDFNVTGINKCLIIEAKKFIEQQKVVAKKIMQ